MTELEVMKNAQACLRLLAQGVDPFTKQPLPETETVRKPAIAKYLNFTAECMNQLIQKKEQEEKRFIFPKELALLLKIS